MQTVHKTVLGLILILGISALFTGKLSASQGDTISVDIDQTIQLVDSDSVLSYNFTIKNQDSNSFVDGFRFSPGFKNYSITSFVGTGKYSKDNGEIIIDMTGNPIPPEEKSSFSIEILTDGLIQNLGGLKRVNIPQIDTKIQIDNFKQNISYPDSWGEPDYSSMVDNSNSSIYMVWGEEFVIDFKLSFETVGKGDSNFFPFFSSIGQDLVVNSTEGIQSVYFFY